jgi:hypothetical protein
MKLYSTFMIGIAALLVTVSVVPAALAGNPTPAVLKALEIRSQGLNQLCGDPTMSREAYRAVCGNVGAQSHPTRAVLQALEIRSRGMDDLCDGKHIATAAGYKAVCGDSVGLVSGALPGAPTASGFDWGDFGVGAGAMLGLVLLTGGVAAGVHYSRKSVRPRTIS